MRTKKIFKATFRFQGTSEGQEFKTLVFKENFLAALMKAVEEVSPGGTSFGRVRKDVPIQVNVVEDDAD